MAREAFMPNIFSKDVKLKLIEYGSSQQGLETVEEIKEKIGDFLHNIIKN